MASSISFSSGEEVRQYFKLLKSNPIIDPVGPDLPAYEKNVCPFYLPVFADLIGTDEFKNDVSSVIFHYGEGVTSVVLKLEQWLDGSWFEVDTLNNNDMGTFYDLGFITDDKGRNYIGYKIEWFKVITDHGEGIYRVKTIDTTIFGVNNQYTTPKCLQKYLPNRANGTVKIETITNNLRGDKNDPTDVIDFGELDWYDSIRVCGIMEFESSQYEREFTEYRNGAEKWIKNEQKPKFILKLKPVPEFVHKFIKTDVLQADEIRITDYNKTNPDTFIKENVNHDGDYAPRIAVGSLLKMVDIKFQSGYNNMRKKRC